MATTRIRTIDFLPEIFKTQTNSQFLAATLDQVVQQPNTKRVQGYVGSKFGYGINAKDKYVVEPTKARTDYQLDPGVVFLNKDSGTANDFISYPGIIDALKLEGGITNNHDRLFQSQFYSWDSFTNLDKLINFNEYYWLPDGPPAVQISTEIVFNSADYTVIDTGNGYQFLQDSVPVGGINPSLTLLRGGTYRFFVNLDSPFWIQGAPGVTGFDPARPNIQTRNVLGVTNNGSAVGVVEFTVPSKNAQDNWNYPGNVLVDLVTTAPFGNINGQLLSTVGNIDGVTALQGRTLMFYQQDGTTGYVSSYYDETGYDTNDPSLTTPQTLTIASANSGTNELTLTSGSTSSLILESSLTFSGTIIGGLSASNIYYVKQITSPTTFTISTEPGGAELALSTGSGIMIANINQGLYEQGFTTNVNQNLYTITYVGDPSNPVIRLVPTTAIPNDNKITVRFGTQYVGTNFVRTSTGTILQYPYLSAILDNLYYQDGSNSNNVGQILLIEDNNTNTLNVLTEVVGKKNYTAPNGVEFTNGLKVFFTGDIFPESFQNVNFYVEGVGTAIELIPETELITPELFSGAVYTPYDTTPYDIGNYDSTLYIPETPEYITIARNSLDRNAWSRSNRWFHKQVINATATYNNDPLIATSLATQTNKARRPIIEFYPNLKLYDSGIIAKPLVDFINFTATDAFTQVAGQEVFYPDSETYTNYSATVPNVTSATTATLTVDANDVTGTFVVGQYINDSANILPSNTQITAISGTTTLNITVSWTGSTSFTGASDLALFANDLPNSGFQLFEGAKIIFANDESTDVRSKIYTARFSSITGSSTPVITLTESPNGQVLPDQQTTILGGYNYIGKTFWYDGIEWVEGQQKTRINQPPLFDIVDENNISFGDSALYPSTSFRGNKLFSYGIGSGPNDTILGFPLRYSGVSNLGDISFDVNLNNDTFDYVRGTDPITQKVNTGYVVNFTSLTESNKKLGWETAIANSRQYQIFNFKYIAPVENGTELFPIPFDIVYSQYPQASNFVCDIAALPTTETIWPNIQVYVNNTLLTSSQYTVQITDDTTTISFNPEDPLVDTEIQILILSDQVSKYGYYQIPINLNNNPLNAEVTTVNVGEIRGHYQSIFYNSPDTQGQVFGSNNYRDLGDLVPYGNRIIQNSASLVLPGVFLRKQNHNLFNALMFNSREYITFKQLLVDTVNNTDFSVYLPAAVMLDTTLDQIASTRSENNAFFWSDMVPSKAPFRTNTYTFANSLDTSIYPLDRIYNFDEANYYGVLVYLARASDGFTQTVQLIRDQDYVVSTDAPSLTVTIPLQPNDVIIINEYNQTYGSFCPNTPTKLGLYPSFIPQVVLDTSYLNPTYFILGHDGSYNKLYGSYVDGQLQDFRDQVLLEFEKRVYNNIKVSNAIPLTLYDVVPGFFRSTDYSYDEILQIYSESFLNWVGQNRIDYQDQYFLSNNQFTYNYNECNNKIDKSTILQGYWRGIYRYFYDTDTPDTTPWEMLGYSNKPDWWETRYGPAPYTSDNLVLWNDLAQGISYNDGEPVVLEQFVRPELLDVIPVDSEGNLVSPFVSVIGNYDSLTYNRSWKVGDGAPAEASYLKSSTWPFDLMKLLALTKPAEFFNLAVDVDHYRYNAEFNQYLVNNRSHLVIDDIQIYGSGIAKNSYINWIVDFEKQFGIDATQNITDLLFNLDVRLVYRLAGFSDKTVLKFYVEKASANSNNSSLLIPDESYAVLLYDNQPFDRIVYSSIVVQIVAGGFKVYGNSQSKAYFQIAKPKINQNMKTIRLLDSSVKVASDYYVGDYAVVPYGTLFSNTQSLSQFLMSYGAYLTQQGMVFEYNEEGVQYDWEQMVKQMLYWAQTGWEIGSTLNLNPNAKVLTIDRESSIVQPLTVQQQNFILNQNLYPVQATDMSVVREGTLFNVNMLNEGDTINYSQFNMSNMEHGIVFNNVTLFNDTIYNLVTGLRQNRIFVTGTKTAEWNGTVDAQGFILNQDNILEWMPSQKYTKGEIVKFKNKYWSALKVIQPALEFQERDWILTDYDEIQKGLLPNPSTQSYEMSLYYNCNEANLEQDADLLAFSLIGFRPRDYLALANLTDITQVSVYKNFIKTKGTNGSLKAFSGLNLPQGTINYDLYENWAIKTSEYGGTLNNNFIDVKLNQNVLTGNPSIIGLTNGTYTEGVQQEIPLYSIYNYGRYINNPDVLFTVPDDLSLSKLPNAGYVNFEDVKVYSYNFAGLPDATNGAISTPITELYLGNYVWLANYRGTWQVFTPVAIDQITTCNNNFDGTVNLIFCCEHNLSKNDLMGVINFNSAVNGYYTVYQVVDPFTVKVFLTLAPNATSIQAQGIGFKLQSQRVSQPSDINNLPLLNTEFVKNKAWVDTNQSGDWSVYRKSIAYNYGNTFTGSSPVTYGSAVAYGNDLGFLIGDSGNDSVYRYIYDPLNKVYNLEQTITETTGYGSVIAFEGNTVVVSDNDSTIYVYDLIANQQVNSLVLSQVITAPGTVSSTWGSAVSLSGDEKWLYISDVTDASVYVYKKSNVTSKFIEAGTLTESLTSTDLYSSALSTDYDSDSVFVSAPGEDFDMSTDNWGYVYAYDRTVQKFESQYNSFPEIPQVFTLAYSPSTASATATGTSSSTDIVTVSDTSSFVLLTPVVFSGTLFGNVRSNTVYYIKSIDSGTQFTISDTKITQTVLLTQGTGDFIVVDSTDDLVVNSPIKFYGDIGSSNLVDGTTYFIKTLTTTTVDGETVPAITVSATSGGSTFNIADSVTNMTLVTVGDTFQLANDSGSMTVTVQLDELDVDVNGTQLDESQYFIIGSNISIIPDLTAGDIITVSGSNFVLSQTLTTGTTPRIGVQFGTSIDNTTFSNEVLVGAPFEINENGQEGAVIRFTNEGKKYGQIAGTSEVNVTSAVTVLLNGYSVTIPVGNAASAAQAILQANITNIQAVANDNKLTIGLINSNLSIPNQKLNLTLISGDLSELGITPYTKTQTIVNPHIEGSSQFGKNLKVGSDNSVVISAPTGIRYTQTTFDFTDDENLDNDTIFDNNFTRWVDDYVNAGAVYMFDLLPAYNESLSNPSQYVYAQSLNDTVQDYGSQPYYGTSLAFNDFTVVIGTPQFEPTDGNVLWYQNTSGQKDWSVFRYPTPAADVDAIKNAQLYSASTNQTLINLDYIDPLQGKLLGAVRQNIDIISSRDPAGYNNSTGQAKNNLVWGAGHVGKIWFNTNNVRFVDYHQPDVTYNSKYWGTVFPGSDVVVCTWIASSVTPDQYTGPGFPFDDLNYSVDFILNASGTLVPTYYFWVRNTNIVFSKQGKTLSDTVLEQYISSPISSGISYFAPIRSNVFGLYNCGQDINDTDTVFHMGFATSFNDNETHNLYSLIRANFADDFLPGFPSPEQNITEPQSLYDRMLDSLAGVDERGGVVPDPFLPKPVQSGILARPRQSFFYNRFLALQNYLTYANEVLKQYPIAEFRTPTFLDTFSDTSGNEYDTRLYWSYINWWAPGYNDTTKSAIQVDFYYQLESLDAVPGLIATVKTNSAGKKETYLYDDSNAWVRIGLENGTIEFSSKLWDYSEGKFGFGDNFFDTTPYDEYPSTETRYIIRALNEQIYTNELLIHRNKSLILLFDYITSETIESQNYLPWLNKTSLVDVSHTLRELIPYRVFQTDNQPFLEGYINEVKPYHVVIKEFLFKYVGEDIYPGDITDFDIPAAYDSNIEKFISPQLVYDSPSGDNQFLPTNPLWQDSKYNQWFNNYGLSFKGETNYPICQLTSYISTNSQAFFVDNAWGLPINGNILVNEEIIAYSFVDRETGRITGLSRGIRGTAITTHNPGITLYMDLSPVIVLNGARGYSRVPKVTAFIDTTIYPEPRKPAIFQANMSLDSVLSISCLDPGDGYAVEPEIIVEPSIVVSFNSSAVSTADNYITLPNLLLQTGDLVQYFVGENTTNINGLVDGGWYYVGVLDSVTYTIGLYTTLGDAYIDRDRVQLYSTGTGSNHSLSLSAKAAGIITAAPVRQNQLTLKYDRTSYQSKITDWTPGGFYGSFYKGLYNNSQRIASSSILLDAELPPISTILASAEGSVFEILSVSNDETISWESRTRRVLGTTGSVSGYDEYPYDTSLYDNDVTGGVVISNYSTDGDGGGTIGFYVGMPVKFSGVGFGNLQVDTIYYVIEVVDEITFRISDENGTPIILTQYDPTPGESPLICIPGKLRDATILTIDYPFIQQATATTAVTNVITVPKLTDSSGTTGFYVGVPLLFTGNVFGGVIENQQYYVTTIIDDEHFTMSTNSNPVITTVTETDSVTDTVTVNSTIGFSVNDAIIFNEMIIANSVSNTFGGLSSGTTYYVAEVTSSTQLKVATVVNGSPIALTTQAAGANTSCQLTNQKDTALLLTATGSMTCTTGQPVSPGQINGQQFNFYPTSSVFVGLTGTISNLTSRDIGAVVNSSGNSIITIKTTEDGTTNMYDGLPLTVSQDIGNLVAGTVYYVIDIGNISATATSTTSSNNTILCDSTENFYIGMPVMFSGTPLGGTDDEIEYYVRSIPSSTRFSISEEPYGNTVTLTNDSGLMTVSGDPYIVVSTSSGGSEFDAGNSQQTASITIAGPAVITVTQAPADNTRVVFSTTGALPTGLTEGVSYYVVNSSGTTFEVSLTEGGTSITTTGSQSGTHTAITVDVAVEQDASVTMTNATFDASYVLGGYRVIIANGGDGFMVDNTITLSGVDLGGTTPTNDLILTVLNVDGDGTLVSQPGLPAVSCAGNAPELVEEYYLKVLTADTVEVYYDQLLQNPVPFSSFGYIGQTVVSATATDSVTDRITVSDSTVFAVNDIVIFRGTTFGNIEPNVPYYILSTPTTTTITISSDPGGSILALATASGSCTVTMTGDYAFLPEPFYFDQSVVKYNNRIYECIVSNNDDYFVIGKWQELFGDNPKLNALDRIIGYYQPTANMPGYDLTQLVYGITYPNGIYRGNPFAPDDEYTLDTILQDRPFYPTDVDSRGVVWTGTNYLVASNTTEYSAILFSTDSQIWEIYEISTNPLSITDLAQSGEYYVMTTRNPATPLLISPNGTVWVSSGEYTPYDGVPYDTTNFDITSLVVPSTNLQSVAYNNVWVAAGENIVYSTDAIVWTEVYRNPTTLPNILNSVAYVTTSAFSGFIAVGGQQEVVSGSGTSSPTIENRSVIVTSPDGITWTKLTTYVSNYYMYGVTSRNNLIVIVGENSSIYTSDDGATWTERNVNLASDAPVLFDIVYANNIFVAVGEVNPVTQEGIILTSIDGVGWQERSSGVSNALYAVNYNSTEGVFIAAGDNNSIITSFDGINWSGAPLFEEEPNTYNVQGGEFLSGYAPEELVAGVVSDNLSMIVTTRPGTNWPAETVGSVSGYGHVGYDTVSTIITPTSPSQTLYSFANKVVVPIQIIVYDVDMTSTNGLGTRLYEGTDYTVISWIDRVLELTTALSANHSLRIDVYEVGNGDQIVKTSSLIDPIRFNTSLGISEMWLSCNYEGTRTQGSGVFQPSSGSLWSPSIVYHNGTELTYGVITNITATQATTNYIVCNSTAGMNVNDTIVFTDTVFGNLDYGITYYVKQIIDGTRFTISTTLGGSVYAQADASGGTQAITNDYAFTLIPDSIKAKIVFAQVYNQAASTIATATQAGTNIVTVNSTSGFIEDQQITFTGNTFGNIASGRIYYVRSIVSATEVIIAESIEGQEIQLTTATGEMTVTVEGPDTDYITLSVFGETEPAQYGATYPVLQTFTADGTVGPFSLTGYLAGDNPNNAVVEVNGLRVDPSTYTIDSVNEDIEFNSGDEPSNGDTVAVTTFNLTDRQRFVTDTFTGITVANIVSVTNSTPMVVTTGINHNLDNNVNTTVSSTAAAGNLITVSSTTGFVADNPIIFTNLGSGGTFGNLVEGTVYYIKTIASGTTFTVSETKGGSVFALSNAAASGTIYADTGPDQIRIDGTNGSLQLNNGTYWVNVVDSVTVQLYTEPYQGAVGAVNTPLNGSLVSGYLDSGWLWLNESFMLTQPLQQENTDRLWVTVDGQRINSSGLYVNEDNNLSILSTISGSETVIITSMVPTATPDETIYINQVDKNGNASVYRANSNARSWLIQELQITDDIIYVQDVRKICSVQEQTATISSTLTAGITGDRRLITAISVFNNTTNLDVSDQDYTLEIVNLAPIIVFNSGVTAGDSITITVCFGNTISINGEKIQFAQANFITNTLSGLTRGIGGTGAQVVHLLYSEVYSYIPENMLPQVFYNQTWNSYTYNMNEGDPLQISTTNAALFLNQGLN